MGIEARWLNLIVNSVVPETPLSMSAARRKWRPTRAEGCESRLDEDRSHGRDCVSQMLLARSRPDVLANALREMGITESGGGLRNDE